MVTHPPTHHSSVLADNERMLFADRLHQALSGSGRTSSSPILLARELNRNHPQLAITYHAVRKWFCGEAIPTQDKMRVLADMLHVHIHWLRYGEGGMKNIATISQDLLLMADIQRLDAHHQALVREFVRLLLNTCEIPSVKI